MRLQHTISAFILIVSTLSPAIAQNPPSGPLVFLPRANSYDAQLIVASEKTVFTNCAQWRTLGAFIAKELAPDWLRKLGCGFDEGETTVKIDLAKFDAYFDQKKESINDIGEVTKLMLMSKPPSERAELIGVREEMWNKSLLSIGQVREKLIQDSSQHIAAYNARAQDAVSARQAREEAKRSAEQQRQEILLANQRESQAKIAAERQRWNALTPTQRAEEQKLAAQREANDLAAQCNFWRKFLDSALGGGDYQRASQVSLQMRSAGCTNYRY